MRKNRRTTSRDDVLRLSWWVSLALVALFVLGVLDGPSTHLGGDDAGEASLTIPWIPVGLVAWMLVASFLRSGARHRSSTLSAPYPTRPTT